MASDEESGALVSWNGSAVFNLYLLREDGDLEPVESFTHYDVRHHQEARHVAERLLEMWRES